jgi:RNA polymerase sigma factor (sigma-70 family)
MVGGVCRRVLGHPQDAEDAFQATFLVLAQSAAKLRKKTALASFLYGTAHRIARNAKRAAARRRKHEGQASARSSQNPADELSWRELRLLLDEEIARLPEKYRSVFLLCCLESLSQAEAARRLGMKEGTLSYRLTSARKLLAQRLSRRGVELSVVLGATALAAPTASALPTSMHTDTTRTALALLRENAVVDLSDLVSPTVAALVRSSSPILSLGKGQLAVVLLLIASLGTACVGVATRCRPVARQEEQPQSSSKASPRPQVASEPKSQAKIGPENEATPLTVHGRVLSPDGKPVADARIYLPFVRKEWNRFEKDVGVTRRGITDSQGRFKLRLSREDIRAGRNLPLLAAAEGYGVTGVELPRGKSSVELTFRLVEDQPIRGKIVNTEGKPLADVRVSVLEVATTSEERLDTFLTAWKHNWNQLIGPFITNRLYVPAEQGLLSVKTDKEGRFQIRGAGRERVVVLRANGPSIAQGLFQVINRPGFDPAPYLSALRDNYPPDSLGRGWPPLLYGPTFNYIADPARPIEGVIREIGSGKPIAGATVSSEVNAFDSVLAVSDAQGRYRLDGVPKSKQYWLRVEPGEKDPWLQKVARVTDMAGWQPLRVDFALARGVVVTGRVIDRTTGKGVAGGVRSVPLLGNKYCGKKPGYDLYRYQLEQMPTPTDADGRFRLVVIPGLSVLAAHVHQADKKIGGQPVYAYKPAGFDPDDLKHVSLTKDVEGNRLFVTAGNSPDTAREYLGNLNAVKVLDPAESAAPVVCNLFVDRGKTLTIRIQDADGKSLPGAIAAGLTTAWPHIFPLKEASCTVYGLAEKTPPRFDWGKGLQILGVPRAFAPDVERPRRLALIHPGRRLAGAVTLQGDEKEPLVVRLAPTGVVSGRVIDGHGEPIAGAKVHFMFLNRTVGELGLHLELQRETIRTDKEGRFRLEGVMPNQKFYLGLKHGHTYLDSEPRRHPKQVMSGETLDLGDVRTTPLGTK